MMNIYNHLKATYHRFVYFYFADFCKEDNWFYSILPQFSVSYNININSDGINEYISFTFLDLLKLYEHHNIQENNLSEKMNKLDVLLSNEHPDMKMNFNTLQYFQVLEQNDMNNEQNDQ